MRWSQFMFYTVSLCVVILLYTITLAHSKSRKKRDDTCLTLGSRVDEDKLLFNETIVEEHNTTNPVVSKDIRFPPLSDRVKYLFTFIIVKVKGGYVNCTSGGINMDFVTFRAQSQEGNGLEFHILIYGFRYD